MKRLALFGITLGLFTVLFAVGSVLATEAGDKGVESAALAPDYKKGELIVKFRAAAPEVVRNAVHGKVRAEKLKAFQSLRLHHVKIRDDADLDEALAAYRDDPAVEYAEPNYRMHLAGTTPSDCLFSQLWGLRNTGQTGGTSGVDISAPLAWDITTGSSSVVIAVIDTGVDYDHPDLVGNLWVNQAESAGSAGVDDDGNGYADDVYGINAQGGSSDPLDDNGHGTHVAGIIGANANNHGSVGVNWRIKMISCKALDQYGSGSTASAVECLEYIRTLKNRGVNIVATNNSWGGTEYSQALYDAINAQSDILFLAAAGNNGADNSQMPFYPASYALPNVVSVAATDHADAKASFSNFGRRKVHVGAPGVDIVSLRSDLTDMYGDGSHLVADGDDGESAVKYYRSSGTSMAAPFVTGLAALLKAQDPGRDWIKIKNLILAGGQNVAALNGATITGRRINAYGSMTCTDRPLLSAVEVPDSIEAGLQVRLSALSINCDSAAGPVTVTTDSGEQILLRDDGVNPDLAAGDGIFTALWTPPADPVFLTFSAPAGTETVTLPLLIIDDFLYAGMTGAPYTMQLKATGGVKPRTWSVSSGVLPDGLTLNTATGAISGVPTAGGTFPFNLTVTDGGTPSRSATKPFSITIYWRPDLVVTSVTYQASASQGQQIPVTFTLKNQSQGVAGSSYASVYISTDPAITGSDIYLASAGVSILAANEQRTVTVQATIPSSLASGTYYMGVIADDLYNSVDESNETNNTLAGAPLTVGTVLPDLAVTSVSGPATAAPGQQVTITTTVANRGSGAAGGFCTGLYLSTDAAISGSDISLGCPATASLAAGGATTLNTTVTLPTSLAPGTYYIVAAADRDGTVAESNESNNGLAGNQISIVSNGPDLVVASVSGPVSAKAGTRISVNHVVKNQGTSSAGTFRVGIYLSKDGTITTSDTYLGQAVVYGLAAGAQQSLSTRVVIPSTLAAGTYYIGVFADRAPEITETNETNNSRAGNTIAVTR